MILEAARHAGIDRVVYGSTVWVYGNAPVDGVVDEETPLALPAHLYTATKLAGEMYCRSYTHLYELGHTILRFGIPYGPRARAAAVVPAFVGRAQSGKALTIAGDGQPDAAVRLRRGSGRGHRRRRSQPTRRPTASTTSSATRRRACAQIADTVRELVARRADRPRARSARPMCTSRAISGERAAARAGLAPADGFADGVVRYLDWLSATSGSPVCGDRSEHRRQRGGRPAPGARRAVVIGVVQQHDVAGRRGRASRARRSTPASRARSQSRPQRDHRNGDQPSSPDESQAPGR